jgi:hypothetical protein
MDNLLVIICTSQEDVIRVTKKSSDYSFHRYYITTGFEINKQLGIFSDTDSFLSVEEIDLKNYSALARLALLYSIPSYENIIILKSNDNLVLVNQNFETQPIEKNITVSNKNIFARLIYNFKDSNDRITVYDKISKKLKIYNFKKKRCDDFKYEAAFISQIIANKINKKNNPLNIDSAISTIQIILKIFKS